MLSGLGRKIRFAPKFNSKDEIVGYDINECYLQEGQFKLFRNLEDQLHGLGRKMFSNGH